MLAPTENSLPQIGDTIAAKYRVEEVLGRGGMGAVFRVTHAVTGKSFAVKLLLPHLHAGQETAQRFIREAQVAGRVDHPNVVEVYDIGEDRGSMYMVMELLQGESLAQHLVRVERVPYSQACQLLIAVTRGLAAAHRSGVIHRDLKPDNIFLSVSSLGEPRPKILDFGISKISALATDANPALTREGVVMGTPHYMAPEQLRSHKVDERCDIYALGVILYQMLSGKLPFTGDNFPDLMLKIISEAPAPLGSLAPDVPRGFVAIIETAMARSAAERFESVADLGRALEAFGEGARFDVEQAPTVRPPSSILPAATTPVATESRFPPTDGQPVAGVQRLRRLAVPIAASALSAALACWVYVSFDNREAAVHAASDMRLEQPPAADSGKSAKPTLQPKAAAPQAEQVARAVTTHEPDALPEPHITSLGDSQLTAAMPPATPPSLIGSSDAPAPEQLADNSEPAAQRTGALAATPAPAPDMLAPSPVPPPGAAAQALTSRTDGRPKKASAKKSLPKYESPEIRINDFFK